MDDVPPSPPVISLSSSSESSSSPSSSRGSSSSSSSSSSIAALLHPDNISPVTTLSALPPTHDPSHDNNGSVNDSNNDNTPISVDPPSTSQPPDVATSSALPSTSASTKPASKAPRSKPQNDPNAPASSKANHKHQSPSPSPPPPPPPPPLQTVRLKITLGGPENYAVDVRSMSRDTGQRPPTPEIPVQPTVVSESESEAEKDNPGEKKKKRKKRDRNEGYYDTSDPFIDDSELALDERTFFAQTKQQGFYVSSGEVALMKDPNATPRKPKSRKEKDKDKGAEGKNYLGGLGLSVGKGLGISVRKGAKTPATTKKDNTKDANPNDNETLITRVETSLSAPVGYSNGDAARHGSGPPDVQVIKTEPMDVDHEHSIHGMSISTGPGMANGTPVSLPGGPDDAKTGEKRKRYTTVVEGGKRKKLVELSSFHPRIQEEVEKLKGAIAQESWENKGKFPPNLKPLLASLALLTIQLDEYDEHFFNLMPQLFPYNKFTMSKLIKRTIFAEHTALLHQRQDALLAELEKQAKEGFANAKDEWERSVVAWDKRQEKQRPEATNGTGSTAGGSDSGAPSRHPTEEMEVDNPPISAAGGGGDTPGGKDGAAKDSQPPAKKYRLTESMKGIIWQLVLLSNECCRLENEKNQLEGSVTVISEQGSRKNLYQKIIACYPEGWLSSGQISRDVSAMKKKFEKEAMENEV